jgi:hypothetical protein
VPPLVCYYYHPGYAYSSGTKFKKGNFSIENILANKGIRRGWEADQIDEELIKQKKIKKGESFMKLINKLTILLQIGHVLNADQGLHDELLILEHILISHALNGADEEADALDGEHADVDLLLIVGGQVGDQTLEAGHEVVIKLGEVLLETLGDDAEREQHLGINLILKKYLFDQGVGLRGQRLLEEGSDLVQNLGRVLLNTVALLGEVDQRPDEVQ